MGGGKTRALETMRRLLLRRDGVLPIAVTFNGDSHVMLDSMTLTGADGNKKFKG